MKTYEIEPVDKFFEAAKSIVGYEIHPSATVTFASELDLTEVERIRATSGKLKPSYTAFVVKALALALRDFPRMNRRACVFPWIPFLAAPRLQQFTGCDIAVIAERHVEGTESISFNDVLRNADRLSLEEITEWLHNLAASDASTNKQWREFSALIKKLPSWLSALLIRFPLFFPGLWVRYRGGAAVVSSPARYGVDLIAASWPWPLGVSFGLVKERPFVRDGQIVPRRTFRLIMNWDLRVISGQEASDFFKRVVNAVEHPFVGMAPFSPGRSGPRPPNAGPVPDKGPRYALLPRDRIFETVYSVLKHEKRPVNTVSFVHEVDLTKMEEARAKIKDPKPSFTAFLVKAVALALKEFPFANRRIVARYPWLPFCGPRLQQFGASDVAVGFERIVGNRGIEFSHVLGNADQVSIAEIAEWLRNLPASDEAADRHWKRVSKLISRFPSGLSALLFRMSSFFPGFWVKYRGGAAVISMPEKYEADIVTAVWQWPLGLFLGQVKQRPGVSGDGIAPRKTWMLTLNWDRRIMLGTQAVRFFRRIVAGLENPEEIDLPASSHEKPATPAGRKNKSSWRILPRDKTFEAVDTILQFEYRPGNTVNFVHQVDLTEIEEIREKSGEAELSRAAFVVKAVALALRDIPYANRRVVVHSPSLPIFGPRLQRFKSQDIAVSLEEQRERTQGIETSYIIRKADKLSLAEITRWIENLPDSDEAAHRRWRRLARIIALFPHWISTPVPRLSHYFPGFWVKYRGGAAKISLPGKYAVDMVTATWGWPLAVFFGEAKMHPVIHAGKPVPRMTFLLSVNWDRRVMAGAQAAIFFKRLTDILEHPLKEGIDE